MTDYERGVEQMRRVLQEVINEYVSENAKLRRTVVMLYELVENEFPRSFYAEAEELMRELGIEVAE